MTSYDSKQLGNLIENLTERTKELNCLYAVDHILRNTESDLDMVFQELVQAIPAGWRYNDICKAQIVYGDKVYTTDDFQKTTLKQSARMVSDGSTIGEVQVYYIKPVKTEKGIFLPEEQKLLNTIAEKIKNYVIYRELRKLMETNNELQVSNVQKKNVKDWLRSLNLTKAEAELFTSVSIQFKKGETICKQGAINSYIMLLADGLSKNYLEGNYERGFNFKIIKPYDFIGLSSLFSNDHYLFSGAALTPCTIFMIEKAIFLEVISGNPLFARHIMTWYCNITAWHLHRLSSIANKQALGRVAETLLYLCEDVFSDLTIPSVISRKDIAELAAMSTESAVRILSDMKNDKIISSERNVVHVLKPDLLRTLAHSG